MKCMIKLPSIKSKFKIILTQMIVTSLIYNPAFVYANNNERPTAEIPNQTWMDAANYAAGFANQYMQMNQSAVSQQMQSGINAMNIEQPARASFFPQCPIPQATPNMPKGQMSPEVICKQMITNPMILQYAGNITMMAHAYKNYYDLMTVETDKSKSIGCMKSQLDSLKKQINARIDELEQHKVAIKQRADQTKGELDALANDLKDLDQELYGYGKGTSHELPPDFKATVNGQDCGKVLTGDLTKGDKGLMGVDSFMTSSSRTNGKSLANQSTDIINSAPQITKEINDIGIRLRNQIGKKGISGWVKTASIGSIMRGPTKFAGLESQINETVGDLKTRENEIRAELAEYNYDLPELDEDFNSKVRSAQEETTNAIINSCVTQRSGFDVNVVLQNLRLFGKPGDRSTTAVRGYVGEFKKRFAKEVDSKGNIVSLKAPVSTLIGKIAALDRQFKAVSVSMKGTRNKSLSKALLVAKVKCEEDYSAGKTLSQFGPRELSMKAKSKKLERAISDLKKLNQNFVNDLMDAITEKIITCPDDNTVGSGECSNSNHFNKSDASFCLARATNCATNVKSCLSKTKGLIKKRRTRMKSTAKLFNDTIKNEHAFQQKYLQDLVSMVRTDANYLATTFSSGNSNFKISNLEGPIDLFIPKMKSPSKAFHNEVELLGDGGDERSINEFFGGMNSLPEQIEKLKDVLRNRIAYLDQNLGDNPDGYIGQVRKQIEVNREKWEEFGDNCTRQIDDFQNKQAQAQAEQAKQQQDFMQKAQGFCQEYEYTTPLPDPCYNSESLAELAKEVGKITSPVNPDAIQFAIELDAGCTLNKEKLDRETKEDDDKNIVSRHKFQGSECPKSKTYENIVGGIKSALTQQTERLHSDINQATKEGLEISEDDIREIIDTGELDDDEIRGILEQSNGGTYLLSYIDLNKHSKEAEVTSKKSAKAIAEAEEKAKKAKDKAEKAAEAAEDAKDKFEALPAGDPDPGKLADAAKLAKQAAERAQKKATTAREEANKIEDEAAKEPLGWEVFCDLRNADVKECSKAKGLSSKECSEIDEDLRHAYNSYNFIAFKKANSLLTDFEMTKNKFLKFSHYGYGEQPNSAPPACSSQFSGDRYGGDKMIEQMMQSIQQGSQDQFDPIRRQ